MQLDHLDRSKGQSFHYGVVHVLQYPSAHCMGAPAGLQGAPGRLGLALSSVARLGSGDRSYMAWCWTNVGNSSEQKLKPRCSRTQISALAVGNHSSLMQVS